MEKEYELLLNDTINGIKLRGFIFGYNSNAVSNYLARKKPLIYEMRNTAHDKRRRLDTSKNLELGTELLSLEVRIMQESLK